MAKPVTEHELDTLLRHTSPDPVIMDILIRVFSELRELREQHNERLTSYSLEMDEGG